MIPYRNALDDQPDTVDHVLVIPASNSRQDWHELDVEIRHGVEALLGSTVSVAVTQMGGFSPGVAARVVTNEGRRAFVKAVETNRNVFSCELHRREARLLGQVPSGGAIPSLIGVHDSPKGVAIITDDIEGRHPALPWDLGELRAVLRALPGVGRLSVDVPTASVALDEFFRGWAALRDDPPPDLNPWCRDRLDVLCEVSDRARAKVEGDALVHLDLRADNVLLQRDGRVRLVDWAHACRGAEWLDAALLLLEVQSFGGIDVDAVLAEYDVARDDVTEVIVAVTGGFLNSARKAVPEDMPTLRAYQRQSADFSLRWA